MGFPTDPLGLRGELLVGDTWTDITGDLYTRDAITHKRGRPYRSNAADPSALSATIRNVDGKYTPRNPEGPYYGKIGRNTPFRITLPGDTRYLDMTGAADRATTPDAAPLDITGDLDVRWEGEADWNTVTTQVLIGKWGTSALDRSWALVLQDNRIRFQVMSSATTGAYVRYPVPVLPRRAALRCTIDADNGSGACVLSLYWATSIDGPWVLLASGTVPGTIAIQNSSAPLSIAPASSDVFWRPAVGRCYRAEVRSGIDGTVVAAPDFTAQPVGATSFTDYVGRVWSVAPGAITDRVVRCEGEVPEWPPKWTPSARDTWTPIEAAGILRRLGTGAKALQSTLRRRVPSGTPRAYWPMEDGRTATQAASPIDGVRPLTTSGLSFASDTTMPGSDALPTLGQTSSISGAVPGAKTGGWHVEMVYKLDQLPSTEQTMLTVGVRGDTGGVTQAQVRISTAAIRVQGLDADGNAIAGFQSTDPAALAAFVGVWNRLQVFTGTDSSTGRAFLIMAWRNVITDVWTYVRTGGYTGTPGAVTSVRGSWGADFQGMAIGHLGVFDVGGTALPNPAPGVTIYNGSDDGFTGETAAARMQRLSVEEDVPLRIIGSVTDTAPVGPQRPAPLLDLLRECAAADGGILGESADRRELMYRTRASLYNQAPKLVLDYAAGQIAEPFEPVEDDSVRNVWEVTREGGSSGTAELTEGALSTQGPPNGIGLVADSVTLNLARDEQTEPMAHWLLHLSTWDEARYPSVTILLHRFPELIPAVLGLREGDKVRIVNLPHEFTGSGTAELLVDSLSETLLPRAWTLTLNCAPAGPWTVGTLDPTITEDFEDTDYALSITYGGAAPWTRSQVHYDTGRWSLRSGVIGNNQTSDCVVAVPAGAVSLAYSYYTSTEPPGPGYEGDRLLVLVDGVQVARAQGYTYWTRNKIDVTGARAVTFRYVKDNSGSDGEDAVWIDNLTFAFDTPMRVDTDGTVLAQDATATDTVLRLKVTAGTDWTTDPADFPFRITVGGEVMEASEYGPRLLTVNPRFTTSLDGWQGVNATIDRVGSPVPPGGMAVVRIVPDGVSASGGASNSIHTAGTVTAGKQYTVSMWAYSDTGMSDVRPQIYWYNAAGTWLGATGGSAIALPAGRWTYMEATYTAPTGATACRAVARHGGTPPASAVWYAWDVRVGDTADRVMAVTRSVNGVRKAQAAGTPVSLADPAIIAL
ncbi:carbohydrate binding domain-containing protein [Streptomyces mexicanus]|uniref:carbohydrate binding domain-containing protein n=1 Tax=Streptomyces mexicanus TaxID=178566 RepID=UPI00365154B9